MVLIPFINVASINLNHARITDNEFQGKNRPKAYLKQAHQQYHLQTYRDNLDMSKIFEEPKMI